MRRIDAHQHFWRLSRGDYNWLTPGLEPIYRDFLPEDLKPLLRDSAIAGTVLVQAAPTDGETEFLLSLADEHAFIEGVVGWTDFAARDAPGRIAALADHSRLKGLRPMIQDMEDDDWMLRADLEPAFEALIDHDLVFDALVLPRHLENLLTLLDRFPRMRTVVDHCAKPGIADGAFHDWADRMTAIAAGTAAYCKLSGLITEAGADWTVGMLRPYVDHVIEVFGPDRLIWGSDWPVCKLAGEFHDWIEATNVLLGGTSAEQIAGILGGNAIAVYRL